MKNGRMVASLLRQIADAVEHMDDEQISQFVRANGNSSRPRHVGARSNIQKQEKIDPGKIQQITRELEHAHTRQRGLDILDSHKLNKVELSRVAKLKNVHFTKDDNIARIREKIVEATIGSRLGSLAVRGE